MIDIKDVLTATPVVLERISYQVNLEDYIGPLIQGLNMACISADGYTMNNIATKLPEETKEGSEHDILMKESVVKISTAIRDSLRVIHSHILPSCDLLDKRIAEVGKADTITDLIFSKLHLKFHHISCDLFESQLFPKEIDPMYSAGVAFTTNNLTELGSWPAKVYEEILPLLSSASVYPELHNALQDRKSVVDAWNTLGCKAYWLGTQYDTVVPRDIDIHSNDINKLIVLTLLINKFISDDDPYPGVVNISLDDYRSKLIKTRAFLNTVLYYVRARYSSRLKMGLIIDTDRFELKYEKCDIKESHFYGSYVLNGGVDVTYDDTIAEYFSNSDDYSLSGIVLGILYAKYANKTVPQGNFLGLLPFYQEMEREYTETLTTAVSVNVRNCVNEQVHIALSELANGPLWADYLSEDGKHKNLLYRLETLLNQYGGINKYVTIPSIIDGVRKGELCLANTMVAVVFAEALGAPIAAEILSNNLHTDPVPPGKQRKLIAKAITKVVVEKLLKN